MSNAGVDLASVFQAVTQSLAEQKQNLNQADTQNQDHGNNMVQTFETITQSLQAKQDKPVSTALNYAAKQLSKKTTSGSGKLYSQGLAQAAAQVKGKDVNPQVALQLLQTLIGGGQTQAQPAQPEGNDMLGSLLSGLMGGEQSSSQPTQQASNDPLESLLGGLTGGQTTTGENQGKLDMGDLLNAGLAYLQAKQSGSSTAEAAVQAFSTASGMGGSAHRQQSTQLVISSFLQALTSMKR
jgi:hypothetical protein